MAVRAAVVFVHGLFSSAAAWSQLLDLLSQDEDVVGEYDLLTFSYASPYLNLSPLRRIPDLNAVADSFDNFLAFKCGKYQRIVIVSHSQGGLVVQRYMTRALADGRGRSLAKIKRLIMFACPNNGSDLLLSLRKRMFLPAHRQERELRPLVDSVTETQRRVLNNIVYATKVADDQCPIPIACYAGDQDNIVVQSSATSVFPLAGVVPGDHFSIIRPDSVSHQSYVTLKANLLLALEEKREERAGSSPEVVSAESAELQVKEVYTELWTSEQIDIEVAADRKVPFFVHAGPADRLRDVDIVVISENVYLQMAMTFKPSVSGRMRRGAARKSAAGEIIDDVASNELTAWLHQHGRFGLPVEIGTVASTSSGELYARGIKRLYHAAIGIPRPGSDSFYTEPEGVAHAVHNVFEVARDERATGEVPLASICFPLLGAGLGRMDPDTCIEWMWRAMEAELRSDPSWSIHFVTWRVEETKLLLSKLRELAGG